MAGAAHRASTLEAGSDRLGFPVAAARRMLVLKAHLHPERAGIIARYACGPTAQAGCDEEEICATRIILNKTGKTTKLAVW
jgi:hypothetical protein